MNNELNMIPFKNILGLSMTGYNFNDIGIIPFEKSNFKLQFTTY